MVVNVQERAPSSCTVGWSVVPGVPAKVNGVPIEKFYIKVDKGL